MFVYLTHKFKVFWIFLFFSFRCFFFAIISYSYSNFDFVFFYIRKGEKAHRKRKCIEFDFYTFRKIQFSNILNQTKIKIFIRRLCRLSSAVAFPISVVCVLNIYWKKYNFFFIFIKKKKTMLPTCEIWKMKKEENRISFFLNGLF